MFSYAEDFNQPINDWDVGQVSDMGRMFYWVKNGFNQPINDWNVGQVNSMYSMFHKANNFDQPINDWNVGQVTSMRFMFTFAIHLDLINPSMIGMLEKFKECIKCSIKQP